MTRTLILLSACLLSTLHALAAPADKARADTLYQQGNYLEAYTIYEELLTQADQIPASSLQDALNKATQSLQRINRVSDIDALMEGTVEAYGDTWQGLRAVAMQYLSIPHHGFVIAGEYERGHHRGGGQQAHSMDRDRVRALQLLERGLPLIEDADGADRYQYYRNFAHALTWYRGNASASWRLQFLTDLAELPDVEEGHGYYHGGATQGAPVNADGDPVYYYVPRGLELAANDGERWRWMLVMAQEAQPTQAPALQFEFANFLENQFSVRTLSQYGFFHAPADEDATTSLTALHTLEEDEALARLANGIKRWELPREFNFIRIYQELSTTGWQRRANQQLAQIFLNRRQYPKAATLYRELNNTRMVKQIVDPWGQFEPGKPQPAGQPATLQYRFRNGERVDLTAHRIDVELLLADVREYLQSNPAQLDHQRLQIENVGYMLVNQDQMKYRKEQVADWSVNLEPRPNHFDKRIEIATPMEKAGAYLVTATMDDGNTSNIVVWLQDTVLVHKPLSEGNLYYLADAVTSEPVGEAMLDFFGWRQERIDSKFWQALGRRYKIITQNFTEQTDGSGQVITDEKRQPRDYSWLVAARSGERRAFLGFQRIWYSRHHDQEYNQRKVLIITDRPVYRPNQTVNFKAWVRHAQYDQDDVSQFANTSVTVWIQNPKGEDVLQTQMTTDAYGGINGELLLPNDATLGVWSIRINRHWGANTFRVEEYKKPEFEVSVEAPSEPIALGDSFTATIKANYYFGAPVVNATVKYKIMRESTDTRWYPSMPWDWFYGKGYWWFSYDYTWYPGWHRWGCWSPTPWWWHRPSPPPELVAEAEVEIGADGTVQVPVDTALAEALHGDQDHRYTITAEVTDKSRRVIVGSGSVLAARQPFNVTVWVDRGYYYEGDTIEAGMSARTPDGRPVSGDAQLVLYRITYNDAMEPQENAVEEWSLTMPETGSLKQVIEAGEDGQYRLSCTVTDAAGHTIEGAYIFTIRGKETNADDFRYNALELIPDKADYAPGDVVKLKINTDRPGSSVLFFARPSNGIYLKPELIKTTGKSTIVEIPVTKKDMPNFFVEALTVSNGEVHTIAREIIVPPEKRVLSLDILPSQQEYKPGEQATVRFRLTDFYGEPFVGSTVVSIYDKAVEYISGGSNVPEIQPFFWKWRRSHNPRTQSNLDRRFHNIVKQDAEAMQNLGVFGHQVADMDDFSFGDKQTKAEGRSRSNVLNMNSSMVMERVAEIVPASTAAPMDARAPSGGFMAVEAEVAEADGVAGGGQQQMVEPTVRTEFADTALWVASLETNRNGEAEVELTMPENLTTWKIATWAMGHGTKVGEATSEVVTTKNVIIRLQAPRFFVEKDEVVLSANVHNYLPTAKQTRVVLELEGGTLELMDGFAAERSVEIGPEGEERIDWRVKVVREGEAIVRMKALTDEESDAMQQTFPVKVHGIMKTVSFSGHIPQDANSQSFVYTVPPERRIEQSRLEIRYSPTLAGAMVDALPYLASYPYGCTEQTLNRFLPTVITQKLLQEMEVDLAEVREKRTNLNAQEIGDDKARAEQWQRGNHNPVWSEAEVATMVRAGVDRLAAMQLSDGGWGWFSGYGEHSYPHTTAVVVHGLQVARENDVALPANMLGRGVQWLQRYQEQEFKELEEGEKKDPQRPYKLHADALDALVYMVLVDADQNHEGMQDHLYQDRTKLPVYALSMFGIALHDVEKMERRDMVIRNIEQYLVKDAENQTAYLNLGNGSYWYYWYGSEYEAHAYYLKLLALTEPKGETAPWLVKYLLNNRKHATYWKSTRDTAYVIEAFADYMRASGENKPDLTLEVLIDGQRHKEVSITPANLFTFDNKVVLEGAAVTSGEHTVEIRKQGQGPLYYNAYLGYFSLEEYITAAGLEIKVNRSYYKLVPKEKTVQVAGSRGQALNQRVEAYERQELADLATLTSGDLVEIELTIESKNDYEYVIFEDYKAAGFEPVDVRSGYTNNGLGAYMELRDDRVAFFVQRLARGKHSVSYRVRAEIPGRFSALPTKAYAMYAPELKGNADEIKLKIVD